MSGLMCSPCSTASSPTLTIAVTDRGSTACTSPARKRAAPTPPARTVITRTTLCRAGQGSPQVAKVALEQRDISVDHHVDELGEADLRLPAERRADLRRVADQQVD